MKYFIGYPISLNCNLRCPYCFNKEFYDYVDNSSGSNKWHSSCIFTFKEYQNWRDTFLTDGTDFILHLFGGEPFCKENIDYVFDILSQVDKEKVDILTNGIGKGYERLKDFKDKIYRVGFTFHRDVINNVSLFENNVLLVKNFNIPIYIKELLKVKHRENIVRNIKYWAKNGVKVKVQDFKGIKQGFSHEEWSKYTNLDRMMIDPEYKHVGETCSCMLGYRNLFLRGFDMADVYPSGGDVIACWHDPTVIGNVKEMWYNSDHKIIRNSQGYDVQVKEKLYRGTHEKDLPNI